MKQTVKLNEEQLRNIIKESVTKFLKEYRDVDFDLDPDMMYARPSGETNIGTGLDWYNKQKGKRSLSNQQVTDPKTGKTRQFPSDSIGIFSHGKGNLCSRAIDSLVKLFQVSFSTRKPTGKIEWSEAELNKINEIFIKLGELARLSKEEGNKKRGYNG